VLLIENLNVQFALSDADVMTAVESASLHITAGRTVVVIGESGSGKSIMGLAVCGLLPRSAMVSGRVVFHDVSLLDLPADRMRDLRGRRIAFVPQGGGLSLNPTMTCGGQVAEIYVYRQDSSRHESARLTRDLLGRLSLSPSVVDTYPHLLSGGMRQRVLVAMGLAGTPDLLIADEPTKGIDAYRRQEVIDLFTRMRERSPDMAVLVITHDIRLAEKIGDEVAVMYAGKIVEHTRASRFFAEPLHPYSRALLQAMPERGLLPIPGAAPRPGVRPQGCVFHPRCTLSTARCGQLDPPINGCDDSLVRCWLHARA
jgi:peptide/nickel transport system ATP-binding protein